MYWDDLKQGQRFVTATRQVTMEDIITFAQLSGDMNPLHLSEEFAANTRYKKPIAHGLLVLSLVSGLAVQQGLLDEQVEAFVALEWRFKTPVYADDVVSAEIDVQRLRRVPGATNGLAILGVEVRNQWGATVQTGSWQALLYLRSS